MKTDLLWTQRDLDIVESLTCRVRLLSLEQITKIWFPASDSTRATHRRITRLAVAGLVDLTVISVHPPQPRNKPLFHWRPGDQEPNFDRVSEAAQSRWRAESVSCKVCSATSLAANLFGSTADRLPPLEHRDHDLLLGQVYVIYRLERPHEATSWVGEDMRPKAGYRVKDPDVFLVDAQGTVTRVVESAGRYSSRQVASFHEYCDQRDLPYELW